MAWWQGILTIVAGNLITLLPLTLTGHAGTKYGIPFPVLCRASFGIRGANLPSCLRCRTHCGAHQEPPHICDGIAMLATQAPGRIYLGTVDSITKAGNSSNNLGM